MKTVRRVLVLLMLSFVFIMIGEDDPARAKNATIYPKKVSCIKGFSFKVKVKNPSGTVEWKSSDESIATVDAKGKVKVKSAGECTITAEFKGNTLSCKIKALEKLSVKKMIRFIEDNMWYEDYVTQTRFSGDGYLYKNYYFEKFFNDCLIYAGVPTNLWTSADYGKIDGYNVITYLLEKKCAKEIAMEDVRAGDFIVWYDEESDQRYKDGYNFYAPLIYDQPRIVTKVDPDGTIYVADLSKKSTYEVPEYFYYYPAVYNTKEKAWNRSDRPKYPMKAIRLTKGKG